MRRLDVVLIALTLVLGTVWFFLRRPGAVPEPAGGVGESQTLSVRLRPVRLAASLDVVHKHAIGSCRGRLSATPAGLRYAAAKGDDGFDVPLSSVERLDADYLKKQLTVKLRGGRTYNFTEAGGNADALVRFQQSVAKAQSRLAASAPK